MIGALADADQLVLSFQLWERWRYTSHVWKDTPGWGFDWSLPWPELVETTRRKALDAARWAGAHADTVATVDWIDESDR